jgi:hypothetical protein
MILPALAFSTETTTTYKAGAFWFGWYTPGSWDANAVRALPEPTRGKYSSTTPAVIDAQIHEAENYSLSYFSAEYYHKTSGWTDTEVQALSDRLDALSSPVKFLINYDQAISLWYQCHAICDTLDPINFNHQNIDCRACINQGFRADMNHIRNTYFDANGIPINADHYMRVRNNTKGAVFIYVTRAWAGELTDCPMPTNCSYHKAVLDARGYWGNPSKLYIIGDEVWDTSYNNNRIDELDAVSAFGDGGVAYYESSHTIAVAQLSIAAQTQWKNHIASMTNEYTGELINLMPAAVGIFDDDHQIDRTKLGEYYG